jgi:acetoin utilization protein AcuC
MEDYHAGFQPGGGWLRDRLDGSSPFRQPWMADSIRGRSWAMHDGIADQVFTDVTMYKRLQDHAGIDTYPGGVW